VDLVGTFMSHGVADLRPGRVDEAERAYTTTLALPRAQPRTIRISAGRPRFARVEVEGRKLGQQAAGNLTATVRHILNWTKTSPSSKRSFQMIPTSVGGFGSGSDASNAHGLRGRREDELHARVNKKPLP
jgi:hypothetical protein